MDLQHAVPFAKPTRVWAGSYADCAGAAVTVIAAGAGQKPGETRLDLVRKNAAIFGQIVPRVAEANPSGIILVATNPVDVLTYETWLQSVSRRNVSAPARSSTRPASGRHCRTTSASTRAPSAFIVGEHGDSEVPVWSSANIAGMRLPEFCSANGIRYDRDAMGDLRLRPRRGVRDHPAQGRHVLRGRGRPAADRRGDRPRPAHGAVGELVDPRLQRDRRRVPVAADGDPPRGRRPVAIDLSVAEFDGLRASARVLRETIKSLTRGSQRRRPEAKRPDRPAGPRVCPRARCG